MHSLGVAGEFGDVAESAQNTRRGCRVRPATPLGAHQAMASTRQECGEDARRLARGARIQSFFATVK